MICVGTMTWGRETNEVAARRIYSCAREYGVTWFDTASLYSNGEAERILGRCMRDDSKRAEVRVSSKGGYRGQGMIGEIEGSLHRLGVERIDIYHHHHWMRHGSWDALTDLVTAWRRGKIGAIGLSNCAAWQAALASAQVRLRAIQVLYNLVKRQAEVELLPLAEDRRWTVQAYSPLASGLLTGKYGCGLSGQPEWRLKADKRYAARYAWPSTSLTGLRAHAKQRNQTPAQLAVAWVETHPAVTMAVVGARNVDQLVEVLERDCSERPMLDYYFDKPPPATDRSEEQCQS
jgi:aryl-alcohol dehydrogenase-like predicted oxidoreductase